MQGNATVFVVDDDPGALRSMRWLLESDGLLVETYLSAREFLAGYVPRCPGCLVLDLRMPEVDGLKLQEELLSRGDHLPVIFVSGQGGMPKSSRAMKTGAVGFLEKPVHDETLLRLVYDAIEQDRRRGAR